MKNQHLKSSAFAAFLFQKLFSVLFSTCFPCWFFCLFGGRDLPLSDPLLEWFLMVWASFWLPKPSRRPSRTHPKKTSKCDAYFYRFGAVLATPGAPKIDEKQLRWYPTALLFWLQKRFCCELGLEDAILDDFGFQNVNCGFQNVNFGRDFVLFFTCLWDLH